MSETLDRVRILVASGQARVSDHGYEQLAEDGILARDAFAGVSTALLSKTIQTPLMVHLFWCCKMIPMADRFISFGASRRGTPGQPLS
jgi:hypothetical protein